MDVSIIIVNYNTKELIRNCLLSIYEQTKDIIFEIIVSDNGSTDGSIEMIKTDFPQVILIENNVNLGFGTANNRGLAVAKGKYVFYLNSDTLLLNNAVRIFFNYWENSENKNVIGALGCNLLNSEKKVTHSYGSFPVATNLKKLWKKRIINSIVKYFLEKLGIYMYFKKKSEIEYFGEVDFITGADLFMKNDKNALFDESIFLYNEDVEIQKRLEQLGLKRIIISNPLIMHLQGMSGSKKQNFENMYFSFGKIQQDLSLLRYFTKHGKKDDAIGLAIILKKYWSLPIYRKYTKKYIKMIDKILE